MTTAQLHGILQGGFLILGLGGAVTGWVATKLTGSEKWMVAISGPVVVTLLNLACILGMARQL